MVPRFCPRKIEPISGLKLLIFDMSVPYLRLVVDNTESAAAPDAGEGKVVVQSEDLLCVVQTLDQSGLICTPERHSDSQ